MRLAEAQQEAAVARVAERSEQREENLATLEKPGGIAFADELQRGARMGQVAPQIPADLSRSQFAGNRSKPHSTYTSRTPESDL
jgi:hypothetical protein